MIGFTIVIALFAAVFGFFFSVPMMFGLYPEFFATGMWTLVWSWTMGALLRPDLDDFDRDRHAPNGRTWGDPWISLMGFPLRSGARIWAVGGLAVGVFLAVAMWNGYQESRGRFHDDYTLLSELFVLFVLVVGLGVGALISRRFSSIQLSKLPTPPTTPRR